ncbi:MAG: hypothetical protein AAFP98_12630 [Pseudomonadota bacterium]
MRMFALIPVIMVAALPATACPSAVNLKQGIKVFEDDGTTHIFRSEGPDTIVMQTEFPDGYGNVLRLDHGAYVTEIIDVDEGVPLNDTLIVYDLHGSDAGPPPSPVAGVSWKGVLTATTTDGQELETQSVIWGNPTTFTVGECDFSALVGEIVYETSDGRFVEEVTYLTDIGIGLQTAWYDPDNGLDRYKPVWIDKVR